MPTSTGGSPPSSTRRSRCRWKSTARSGIRRACAGSCGAGSWPGAPAPTCASPGPPADTEPHRPFPGRGAAAMDLIVQRPEGLYCPPGDFYIDPWRPVDRAVITHAHADHARTGHGHYLAAAPGEGVPRQPLGELTLQPLAYGEPIVHNGVEISLHPAGHVLGSAQVRLAHGGQVWVASGDYKVAPDPTCVPFAPQRCDVFIT